MRPRSPCAGALACRSSGDSTGILPHCCCCYCCCYCCCCYCCCSGCCCSRWYARMEMPCCSSASVNSRARDASGGGREAAHSVRSMNSQMSILERVGGSSWSMGTNRPGPSPVRDGISQFIHMVWYSMVWYDIVVYSGNASHGPHTHILSLARTYLMRRLLEVHGRCRRQYARVRYQRMWYAKGG